MIRINLIRMIVFLGTCVWIGNSGERQLSAAVHLENLLADQAARRKSVLSCGSYFLSSPLIHLKSDVTLRLRGGYRDSDVLRHYVLVMSKADRDEDIARLQADFEAAEQATVVTDVADVGDVLQAGGEDLGVGQVEGGTEHASEQESASGPVSLGPGDSSRGFKAKEGHALTRRNTDAARLAHRIGVVLFDVQGNASGAEFYFKASLKQDPTYVAAAADYACLVHRVHKDYDNAEVLYEKVLTMAPGHVATLCNSAWLLYTYRNQPGKAESYLRLALSTDQHHPDALHMLARVVSETQGNLQEAELLYQRALEHHPEHVDTLWSYGTFLMDYRDDEDGAERIYARAVLVDPTLASME